MTPLESKLREIEDGIGDEDASGYLVRHVPMLIAALRRCREQRDDLHDATTGGLDPCDCLSKGDTVLLALLEGRGE